MAPPIPKFHPLFPLCLLFALFLPLNLWWDIFPQANFHLKIPPAQVQNLARPLIEKLAPPFSSEVGKTTQFFHFEHHPGFYFQKSFGASQTNEFYREGKLPFFYWVIRHFAEGAEDEFRVYLSPEGRLVGFRHLPPEEAPWPDLGTENSRALASEAILMHAPGIVWEWVEEQRSKLPKRMEYSFTFRETRPYSEAEHRLIIQIAGDKVLNFRRFIKVPQRYVRQWNQQRAIADLLFQISVFLDVGLAFAALFTLLKFLRHDPFEPALPRRVALLIYAVLVATILNYLPNFIAFNYLPEKNYTIFILSQFLEYATWALIPMAAGFLMYCAALPLVRRFGDFQKTASFEALFRGDWRHSSIGQSCAVGVVMAIILGGGETCFYYVTQKFCGVWIPLRNDYANSLSTPFPLFLPLSIGIGAGITEEIVFRLFAISYLRSRGWHTFWQLLLPAIAWGFAHSHEWVFPVYIRGLELVLGGLLFGWFYLKSDLLSVIVAHYLYDVVAFGWPLLIASDPVSMIMGMAVVGVAVVPAGMWVWGQWRSGGLNFPTAPPGK